MTKWELINAFMNREPITIISSQVCSFQVINQIEHEDGGGSSFNVTGVNLEGKVETVHVRTED